MGSIVNLLMDLHDKKFIECGTENEMIPYHRFVGGDLEAERKKERGREKPLTALLRDTRRCKRVFREGFNQSRKVICN